MKCNHSPEAALSAAKEKGFIRIGCGVYLSSQESIVDQQRDWQADGTEGGQVYDFTSAPFWLTTDCGADPQPIYDASDVDLGQLLANDEESE